MKTSKAKANSKPKKSSVDEEVKMSRKPSASKPVPTVEEIRIKAYEIYNQRINRGYTELNQMTGTQQNHF